VKNFEDRLTRLESLNEKMKEGNVPLDEAVSLFEEGIKLARGLEKELSKIERKIEILVNEPEKEQGDEPNLELFSDMGDEGRDREQGTSRDSSDDSGEGQSGGEDGENR
jgi:exodeoxyribonuclease VII small subunit